jgi:Protein of unknown function (DUF3800)
MSNIINVYCDESCHLEHDGHQAMIIGAVWSPDNKKAEVTQRINDIRAKHKMPRDFEFKWTKISPSKLQMYMDIVDYFFDDDDLSFRCVVVANKNELDHARHGQTHDDWYYKMYFTMLKTILRPKDVYHIYIDIKDTKSKQKIKKLHDILCNNSYDYSRSMIERVQQIRSNEIRQAQLADILIGAMSYKARKLDQSQAKNAIVERIAQRSGYSLERNTLIREYKFNILVWHGAGD